MPFLWRFAVRLTLPFLLPTLAVLSATPALAQQKFENLDRIDSLVAMTVGANIGQPGGPAGPVDRRLHLAACPQTPTVEGPVFGAAMVKCEALGWRIRVPLAAGMAAGAAPGFGARGAVTAQRAPAAVKKGDPVQLIAGGAAFSISRTMVADEDGAIGEMIRVREDRKSAPVIAQVADMWIVRVPGFKEN